MTRKFKALGLSLVAVVAFSAVVASAAQAKFDTFVTHTGGPVILTGKAINVQKFKAGLATVECTEFSLQGPDKTNTAKNNTTELTVSPLYNKGEKTCTTPIGKATVSSAGCHYLFTSETNASEKAEVHVVCDVGKSITIQAPGCLLHVFEQTIPGAIHYKNNGTTPEDDVIVQAEAAVKFTSTEEGSCALAGIPKEGTATYTGEVTATADEDLAGEVTGKAVGIHYVTKTTTEMP